MRYFKQSWQVIKQNKLFSSVYIVGTALAIAMVMAYAIVWYIKIAPVPPELNRGRVLYMSSLTEMDAEGGRMVSNMSKNFVNTVFPDGNLPQEIECVAEYGKSDKSSIKVYSGNVPDGVHAAVNYVTANICKVFDYRFLYGMPFTEEEGRAGVKKAFITREYAWKLFGKEDAVGEIVKVNSCDYVVCGVVKEVSNITNTSYGDIWLPITTWNLYGGSYFGNTQMLGSLSVIILARSSAGFPAIKKYVDGRIRQINASLSGSTLSIYGQPDSHFVSIFRKNTNAEPKLWNNFLQIAVILLALLLVPAVNLAGIIASGMERRLEELGIRKAFGASRSRLLWQILCENFLLTFTGGMLGLLISWVIVWYAAGLIFQMADFSDNYEVVIDQAFITSGMLFNIRIFIMAFAVCLLVNLLAAIVPAFLSLRKNIIYSLTCTKK